MAGNYYADAGGGSCSTFSAAANHDINGYVVTAGGMTMGSGTYTINGYIAFGDNGGGSVSCNGTTVGMTGTGVTFIVTGATTPGSGTCKNMVLCFGAGFNYVALIAPTSGNFANALFIGPLTGSGISAGALFSGGAGASMSGALYIPSGVLTMSGGALHQHELGPNHCERADRERLPADRRPIRLDVGGHHRGLDLPWHGLGLFESLAGSMKTV